MIPFVALCFIFQMMAGEVQSDWSQWTAWSQCSRTCDGGAAHRLRTCQGPAATCKGPSIRYMTCNNQACDNATGDFRAQQCAAHDDQPYRGKLYEWEPSIDSHSVCSLICSPRNHSFRVALAPKVLDGTRCGLDNGTFNMCINGECHVVGCDHILGSNKTLDECGVCGGDGSTCQPEHTEQPEEEGGGNVVFPYVWRAGSLSACSVTCGVGVMKKRFVCKDSRSDLVIPDKYCSKQVTRPVDEEVLCRMAECEPVWITKEWQPCSRTCGRGSSRRHVYCVRALADGSFQRIGDTRCRPPKPAAVIPCNQTACPMWYAGQWSPCSKTCGRGHQLREVICRREASRQPCSRHDKPATSRACLTGLPCINDVASGKRNITLPPGQLPNATEAVNSTLPPPRPTVRFLHEPDGDRDETHLPDFVLSNGTLNLLQGKEVKYYGKDPLVYVPPEDSGVSEHRMLPWSEVQKETGEEKSNRIDGQGVEDIPTLPTYIASEWGPCTVSCGPGFRYRVIRCKVFLPFLGRVEEIPEKECKDAVKPATVETCDLGDCPAPELREFVWELFSYGPCTVTCGGGGYQTANLKCRKQKDMTLVHESFCGSLPDIEMNRECGGGVCPPSWEIGPMGPCSAFCGGGSQSRSITCVVKTSPTHKYRVPDSQCKGLSKPTTGSVCNPQDCEPMWITLPWSNCSVSCGLGAMTRKIICQQIVYPNQLITHNGTSKCDQLRKPITTTTCVRRKCPFDGNGIEMEIIKYVQMKRRKRVTIKSAQQIYLLPNTTATFICPFNVTSASKVKWHSKRGIVSRTGPRIRVTKKGALRIIHALDIDKGDYTCKTLTGSIYTLTLHFITPEEASVFLRERRDYLPKKNRVHVNDVGRQLAMLADLGLSQHQYMSSVNEVLEPVVQYVPASWSPCSSSCGRPGIQVRDISCEHVRREAFYVVPGEVCIYHGLGKPRYVRTCGLMTCPAWRVGKWEKCHNGHCVRPGYASTKRDLHCTLQNGTRVEPAMCEDRETPTHQKECRQAKCTPVWKVSPWTKCNGPCGGKGQHTRMLHCVWAHSRIPAGPACRGKHRPPASKHCITKACHQIECEDDSRLCVLIPRLHMCRFQSYRRMCCKSCTKADKETGKWISPYLIPKR